MRSRGESTPLVLVLLDHEPPGSASLPRSVSKHVCYVGVAVDDGAKWASDWSARDGSGVRCVFRHFAFVLMRKS